MANADIITLHIPATKETAQMINAEMLSLMKPSAILINTARGAVVDNNALAQALKDGKIAGAGIDVYETEPPLPKNHPLLSAPNAATREAFDIRADIVMDNIRKWLAKQ